MKGKKINPEQMKPDKANEREGDKFFIIKASKAVYTPKCYLEVI